MIDAAHLARKSFFAVGRTLNLRALTPRRMAGAGAILMLHRVSPQDRSPLGVNAGLSVTPDFLDKLVGSLKSEGYEFVALEDIPARLAKPDGKPFLAVTFDDGYKDNALHAYPVLRRHDVPWTVYIAPGVVDGEAFLWWELLELALMKLDAAELPFRSLACRTMAEKTAAFERIQEFLLRELPEVEVPEFVRTFAGKAGIDAKTYGANELLDWNEISALAKDPLCTIGNHTMRHHHLARLSDEALAAEFAQAHAALESRTGIAPKHVAYPYGYELAAGRRETEHAEKLGYTTGVTTRHGMLFGEHLTNVTALPRISVNGRHQNVGDVRLMLSGLTSLMAHRHGGPVTL